MFMLRHEAICIKEIVDTISLRLLPLMSSANTDLIGIETRVQDFKSRLEIGLGDVRMVGIWGVGGGGKTTLAFSVFKEISHEFDGCSFMENVQGESSKYGLIELQEKVLSDVLKGKVVVRSVEEGKLLIKRRLCRKSVLIILDDINQREQLEALAGSHEWFGVGSRIIITTRDVNLLEAHRVKLIHDVNLLTRDEAIHLFSRHAFGESSPAEGYEKLSKKVVSRTGGLPLALKVLGSFLCGKNMNEWISALARLKDIPDNKILEKLKISYDGLERVEKKLFLDLACFFSKSRTDGAIKILDALWFSPCYRSKGVDTKGSLNYFTWML